MRFGLGIDELTNTNWKEEEWTVIWRLAESVLKEA